MKFINIFLICSAMLLGTACGGSGGGNSNSGGGNGSSSSNNGTPNTEIVFGDSLNSSWGKFTAYEFSNTLNSGFNYDDGQTANFLQWKIVNSSVADHKSVIEVSYAPDQDARWAQFYITPSAPTDLSRFETGIFSFDINVLDWGDAYDSATGTATFEVRVECTWPCASHAINVTVDKSNEWKHVDINVSEFTNGGADLTKLDGTLLIKPLIGRQKGTRYQLDNIKWTKGAPLAKRKIIFEEHFNTFASKDAWVFLPVNGLPNSASSFVSDGLVIYAGNSNLNFYDWAIETTLTKSININHKKIKIQFYPSSTLIGSANLALVAVDDNGNLASTPQIFSYELTPYTWKLISFDVDNAGIVAGNSFDFGNVRKLRVVYYANGQVYSGSTGWLEMDEILITE